MIDELEACNRTPNLITLEIPLTTFAGTSSQPSQDGEPATSSTTVENAVPDLTRLEVKAISAGIFVDHSLRQKPFNNRLPSVIVRFTNTKARDAVYRNRCSLTSFDTPIYIDEDSTKSAADLYRQPRSLVKIKCYTLHGLPVERSTYGTQGKPAINLSKLLLKPLFKLYRNFLMH